VTPSALVDSPTVASFAVVIDGDMRHVADRMLVPVRTSGARPPLVLIHGFDGQMLFVKRLAWLMPPDLPIYGIQARGMDGRSEPHATVDEMARAYAAAILDVVGSREIFLGGYCMGGVIAIEVLRHLLTGGGKARRLIMIDPPPRPVRKAREMSRMSRDEFVAERADVLIRRFADFTGNRPDLASHYGPSGEGLTHALHVARGLAMAYGRFVPSWTRFPSTILWSVDRAEKHGGQPHEYRLTRGPTTAYVVRNRRRPVTHRVLLREGIQPIAHLLKKTMGIEDVPDYSAGGSG
jgi:pimeloyl-ACP methyl ester carboxylesterase